MDMEREARHQALTEQINAAERVLEEIIPFLEVRGYESWFNIKTEVERLRRELCSLYLPPNNRGASNGK